MKKVQETVSIHCMTYNHAEYIRDCLEGFVKQKTNFPFVAYVGDDCSTDGTAEIVKEYEKKYPDIIKGIYHKKNTKAEGNFFDILKECQGKYLIFCEGDDYWTDENKLQKQVDFMEQNPEYSICFHAVQRNFENNEDKNDTFPSEDMKKKGFNFKNLLQYNFMQTNSVLYRREVVKNLVKIFPKNMMPGDWYMHLLFAKEGKIKYFDDVMSVYRVHSGGAWGNLSTDNILIKYCFTYLNFFINVHKNIAIDKNKYLKFLNANYNLFFKTQIKHKKYKNAFLLIIYHPILFSYFIVRYINFINIVRL